MLRLKRQSNKNNTELFFKKCTIHLVLPLTLLIMLVSLFGYGQKVDTLYLDDSAVDQPIIYSAKDSIYTDLKNKQVHLFNEAKVDNGEIKLKAGYILIDLGKNEVYARYSYDEDSNRVQLPEFSDGKEVMNASAIRYNTETKKGYIEEVAIKQDENYLYMEVAKRHSNEEIHFLKGRFTTCDLPDPHYHFQLSRAVMIPEKRIVSGPMNLWLKGVPTPLGLPFIVIPQSEDRTSGLVFPQIVPTSQYGFGLQDLGYYIPINDRLQTTLYGSLYSRGTWGLRNLTEYAKRYKYQGDVDLGFQQFRSGFPTNTNRNKLSLLWNHRQDTKANPFWNFSSNVNFVSDNTTKNDLDPLNEQYFNNTLYSDINLNRSFPGKPITAGMKISLRQNSLSKNISLTSPSVNVNVTRFFPFKKMINGTGTLKDIVSRIGVAYNFEGINKSEFGDSLLSRGDFAGIGNQYMNGMNQTMVVQTTAGFFKNTWKLTPSLNYGNRMNFQQVRKSYDAINNATITDTIGEFGMAHSLSMTAQMTTAVYSYYKFIGKRQSLLRHVLTPSFGFSYVPALNRLITDSVGVNMAPVTYSPFERSAYTSGVVNDQALLTFGFNNTFELKRKSDKDTITGFKKTRIIDALSINGTYDLMKDSMNLSDIRINMRISPMTWLNFVASSSFSPYNWSDSTGATLGDYAINGNGRLGRFITNSFSTTLTITSKESHKKLESTKENIETNWNADYEYFMLYPERVVNFEIPWKMTLSHVYTINANRNISTFNPDRWTQVQTLVLDGDLSFTKRWKVVGNISFDMKEKRATNARFALTRDMHCWALSFNWVPLGGNKSFLFSIRSTSQLFKDAKIDIRKPPLFL